MATVGDIYRATFWVNVNGNTAGVNFWYQQTNGPESVNRTLHIATQLGTVLPGFLIDVLAGNAEMAAVDCVQVDEDATGVLDPPATFVLPYTLGEAGDQSLPLTKAVVVKLLQSERGGRHNGRQYWPGFSEDASDGNVISDTGLLSDLTDGLAGLQDFSIADGGDNFDYQQIVWSTQPLPLTALVVEAYSASPTIFSQRRRRTEVRGVKAVAP